MGSQQKEGTGTGTGTSYQASEPKPCANNCGFFGTTATMNLCSKCYKCFLIKQEQAQADSAKAPLEVTSSPSTVVGGDVDGDGQVQGKAANRCWSCKKKVGLIGLRCKCGRTFCGKHRYPEMHECTFDFKVAGRDVIAKGNPVVKADKLHRF